MNGYKDRMKEMLLNKWKVLDATLMESIIMDYEDSPDGLSSFMYDLRDINADIGEQNEVE